VVVNIVFVSCGNDSTALAQWCFNNKMKDLHFAYSETHWGTTDWAERVKLFKHWVELKGAKFHTINSDGFESICKSKPAIPTNGRAFCSYELKILPAQKWLDIIDPEKEAVCYTGVRRCESVSRSNWPEWIEDSENHGGRSLCSPLVRHLDNDRDDLIEQTPFPILEHRSMECSPCVNANTSDLRKISMRDIEKVEQLELEVDAIMRAKKILLAFRLLDVVPQVVLGKEAQDRFMFRSGKCGGAQGIRQVIDWANTSHGKYEHDQLPMFGCESGFCGQ